jgi:GT2 family glycosyltransferase
MFFGRFVLVTNPRPTGTSPVGTRSEARRGTIFFGRFVLVTNRRPTGASPVGTRSEARWGQAMMNVFGMVTTAPSRDYTALALRSFFAATPLGADDRFYLIDNDASADCNLLADFPHVMLIANSTPQGFAANVNQVMDRARPAGADLFFLNNDLVFSSGWLTPLLVNLPVVLSPVSNYQMPYRSAAWDCGPFLDLGDYLDHSNEWADIVGRYQSKVRGYRHALNVPFFAVKLPYAVYSAVGPLDEAFGRGGGEDGDYCLRCHLASFGVLFALDSYLLHFMGKSTWRGPESVSDVRARQAQFIGRFQEKWGQSLADLVIPSNCASLPKEHEPAYFPALVERLAPGCKINHENTKA